MREDLVRPAHRDEVGHERVRGRPGPRQREMAALLSGIAVVSLLSLLTIRARYADEEVAG